MPGMAASSSIFEHIELPKDKYRMHLLEWLPPEHQESLESYTKRVGEKIVHENPVLIGVSFGGVIVQELRKFLKVKKIIIISSAKCRQELPLKMKITDKAHLYKVLPTSLAGHLDFLEQISISKTVKSRIKLYKKYIHLPNKYYLRWAIEKMVTWKQNKIIEGVIHIHGEKDEIFPIQYIKNAIIVPGGTHVMIVKRFRWFNENLEKIIAAEEKVKI